MEIEQIKKLASLPDVVLLRPHRLGESLSGGDFDFLQSCGDELGEKIEEEFGRPVVKIVRTYVHQRYYEWGQIDVLPSLEWNGFRYADAEAVIFGATVGPDGVRRPRLGHDGVISWLTSLLWGGFYKEKYDEIITLAAKEDSECFYQSLEWAFGTAWADEMMEWARAGRASESAKYVEGIRRALKWKQFRRSGGDTIYRVCRHWRCEAIHHMKPQLPMLAFVGPDGSGKSSVIAGVCDKLCKMGLQQKFLHWRPYGIQGREDLGQPVSNPHADPARGWLSSTAKLGVLFWDWWLALLTVLKHARAKTSVVVSDRYYNDMLVDPVRYRYGAGLGLARRVFSLFPKPDLVFVLVGDPETIYPRKKELPMDVLRQQLVRYRNLGKQLGDSGRLVNVNDDLNEVIEEVFSHLMAYFRGEKKKPFKADMTRHLRVAQFVPHYPSVEGISAYCRGLSREMNLISPGSCPVITLRTELKNLSGDEELLHYPHDSKNPMSLPKALILDLEKNVHQLDGVVFHGAYHPKVGMLRRHLTRIGIPFIFVPHDPYVPELTQHHALRKWVFWHVFEKRTIRNSVAVQLLAGEHESPLRKLGFDVPTEVIPNGCELETISEIPDQVRVPGKGDRIRIQFIGRMDRNHKGLDLLVEAFGQFVKEEPFDEVDLILTGNDWEDREELENLSLKLGLKGRVVFTGPRPEHSLVIHSEADIVVLPSRFDGFGLCIVEAMLAARPVLVSRRAGVSSHVDEAGGGWLLEPTVEGIRNGLVQACLARDEWPKMGEANRDYVINNLTWKQAAQKTLAMYRRHF
ncbi:MAG: glycosyltransferase [Akkermansiaceae bacterium]